MSFGSERIAVRKRVRPWNIIAFVLGLSFLQGIAYVTKVGNLYVDAVYPMAVLALAAKLIFDPKHTIGKLESCFCRRMLPFLLVIALSGVLALVSCVTHQGVQISSYLNGLVVLAVSLCVYFAVIAYHSQIKYIALGLWIGLLVNIVVSFMQYAAFQAGTAFTLYGLFPQPAFYISVPWGAGGAWAENIKYLVYSFRAQGLYLEVSYFVGAATIVYIAAPSFIKTNGTFRAIVLAALLFLFGMSGTGNLVLFIGFIMVACAIHLNSSGGLRGVFERRRTRIEWMLMLLLLIGCLMVVLLFVSNADAFFDVMDFDVFSKGWADGIASSNLSDADNSQRLTYMLNAVAEFARYPWGGGYNMAPALTFADYGTNTTFSYALTLLVELGPIGLATYLYFIGSLVVSLAERRSSRHSDGAALSVAVLALFAFQVANGIGLTPLAWCVFALASIELYDKKKERGSNNHGIESERRPRLQEARPGI